MTLECWVFPSKEASVSMLLAYTGGLRPCQSLLVYCSPRAGSGAMRHGYNLTAKTTKLATLTGQAAMFDMMYNPHTRPDCVSSCTLSDGKWNNKSIISSYHRYWLDRYYRWLRSEICAKFRIFVSDYYNCTSHSAFLLQLSQWTVLLRRHRTTVQDTQQTGKLVQGWISYSRMGAFHNNFGITIPEVLTVLQISACFSYCSFSY